MLADEQLAVDSPSIAGLHVLLVDKPILEDQLVSFGAHVTSVASAEAALLALHKTRHDVVIGGDGEVLRAIRDLSPLRGSRIPAVAVLGAPGEVPRDPASAGYDAVLHEPVRTSDLVATIALCCRRVEETRLLRRRAPHPGVRVGLGEADQQVVVLGGREAADGLRAHRGVAVLPLRLAAEAIEDGQAPILTARPRSPPPRAHWYRCRPGPWPTDRARPAPARA